MDCDDVSWQLVMAGQAACILEADAPKVGNVNRQQDFSDCRLEDFHISALMIGQVLANVPGKAVGQSLREGIVMTRRAVPTNTNLGILLLLIPLAKAWAVLSQQEKPVRTRERFRRILEDVLEHLSIEDCRDVYEGIRRAQPSGLGKIDANSQVDLTTQNDPEITLYTAMTLSAERDLIASQYVTGFQLLWEEVIPLLEQELGSSLEGLEAIAQTALLFLSHHHDTQISRKHGLAVVQAVCERAKSVVDQGGWHTANGRIAIVQLDAWLRGHTPRLNPGTTADFMAAALFVLFLEQGPSVWKQLRSKVTRNDEMVGFGDMKEGQGQDEGNHQDEARDEAKGSSKDEGHGKEK